MPDLRPVLFANGCLLLVLAAAMGLPLGLDVVARQGEWPAFLAGIMITAFLGLALIFSTRGEKVGELTIREAFLLVATAWLLGGLCGAVPFALSSRHLSLSDAVFETISGLTTTGATVITGLDQAPSSLLLWRALLNWLGGVGIIAAAVAILPRLRIGGMQLFRMESADKTDKLKPRVPAVMRGILIVYVLFTLLLAIAFATAGMTPLEAVCHAMSSLSTGGFSTSDQSLGHFGVGAQMVCMVGMIAGGATFTLFVTPWKHGEWALLTDSQVRWFLTVMAVAGLALAFWNWAVRDMDGTDALCQSLFSVVSILSTTGFHVGDYDSWGGFAQILFFVLAFVGGCTGSAAGGIKIFRFEVLFVVAGVHLKRLLHPHGIFTIDFNRLKVSDAVVRSVLGFMMLYFFGFAGLTVALTLTGLDAFTGLSAAAATLGNVGPGLGPLIGPTGSYQLVPDSAKWLLVGGMILGRLELAAVIVFFTRAFWRE